MIHLLVMGIAFIVLAVSFLIALVSYNDDPKVKELFGIGAFIFLFFGMVFFVEFAEYGILVKAHEGKIRLEIDKVETDAKGDTLNIEYKIIRTEK